MPVDHTGYAMDEAVVEICMQRSSAAVYVMMLVSVSVSVIVTVPVPVSV